MHTLNLLAAAACLLAVPLASGAECSGKVSKAALNDAMRQPGAISFMGGDVRGQYSLSNGQRLKLLDHYGDLVAVFDGRRPVRLEEIGANRFASHEGDVELSWEPRTDIIRVNYPADSEGRLLRACEG